MRILALADLHYALKQFDWLGEQVASADIIVLAGDLLDMGSAVDMEVQSVVVQKYLRRYAGERVLLTSSGNHDIQDEDASGERVAAWMEDLFGPSILTDNTSYEREGILFSVCSWWDGPESRARTEARLREDATRPKRRWIWLHHNPPAGTPVAWNGRADVGDKILPEWIAAHQPDIVFSGHIHNAPYYGAGSWHARMGKTWIFNPGKQLGGEPTRIQVDLEAGTAEWFSIEGTGKVELWSP